MEVTYRMQNGYQVPNLLMPQTPEAHLGKYAELRREYLKKHRRVLYTNLKTSGKLTEHLAEIEQTARKMVEQTVTQMAAVLLLLLLSPVTGEAPLGEGGKVFADVVMYISTFFSLVSCVDYIARNRDCLKDK